MLRDDTTLILIAGRSRAPLPDLQMGLGGPILPALGLDLPARPWCRLAAGDLAAVLAALRAGVGRVFQGPRLGGWELVEGSMVGWEWGVELDAGWREVAAELTDLEEEAWKLLPR